MHSLSLIVTIPQACEVADQPMAIGPILTREDSRSIVWLGIKKCLRESFCQGLEQGAIGARWLKILEQNQQRTLN